MTKFNKFVIGAILVLAIGLGLVYFVQPSPQVIKEVIKEIGAMPGSELQGPEFTVGGVGQYFQSQTMKSATTTICRLQSPNATSTIIFASVDFRRSTSTGALILDIAKTTNESKYATTTKIGSTFNLVNGNQITIMASSTIGLAGTTGIFSPNDWLVVNVYSGEGVAGLVPIGTCEAEWRLAK